MKWSTVTALNVNILALSFLCSKQICRRFILDKTMNFHGIVTYWNCLKP